MRRVQFGLLTFALPVLALSLVLAGCGGKEEKGGDKKKPSGTTEIPPPSGGRKAVKGNGTSTIKGAIKLVGAEPDLAALNARIKMEMDKNESDYQGWRIGANKQVANVFVWLQPENPKTAFFPVSKDEVEKAKDHPASIDQPHCAFIPHCVVLFQNYYNSQGKLTPTGQKFLVKNSSETGHNTAWVSSSSEGNKTRASKAEPLVVPEEGTFKPSNDPVRLSCKIHGWMNAVALSVDNPYATISLGPDQGVKADDPKFGTFEIKGVPAGIKVRIFAWHEVGSYLNKNGNKGEVIEVKEGETPVNFPCTKGE
jgi:hypothetical protein